MPSIRQILNHCSLGELRSCANVCLLPDSGSMSELISRLVRGASPYQILEGLGRTKLKEICRLYDLPVSGNIDTLVGRILEITTMPARAGTAKKKCDMCGHLFDQRALEEHHFVPKGIAKARWGYVGGVVLLCGTCHNIFHRRQDEEEAKKGRKLTEDEIKRLFNRTKKERQAGKYGKR